MTSIDERTIARARRALRGVYALEAQVGAGGMAAVWRARDERHGRAVALKLLSPTVAQALGPARFLREIRVAASLVHPHILPVLDSGEADGLLWYAMPLVEGGTLRARLARDGALPLDDAVRLTAELLEALAHAHARDIVHRDVKPENVLLADGHVQLADFGIARADDGAQLTSAGIAVGTPAYMAPEQAMGLPVDARSDAYSAACVLYELLAGEAPFAAPTAQGVLAKRLALPAPDVRVLRETVPPAVAAVLARALARTPADRFADADAFRRALLAAADGSAPTVMVAPTPTAPTLAAPTVAPRRVPWVAIALAGLVVAAGVALGLRRGATTTPADATARPRIVVAPFADRTAADSLAVFSRLAQDWVSRGLLAVDSLDVATPPGEGDGGAAAASATGALELARRSGAAYAVTGAVTRLGDSLRFEASLLEAARGTLVQSVVATAPTSAGTRGLGALADRLAGAVARTLDPENGAPRGLESEPPSLEAYRLFQQGLGQFYAPGPGFEEETARLFTAAWRADTTMSYALLWAAWAYKRLDLRAADSLLQRARRDGARFTPLERAIGDRIAAELRGDRAAAYLASRAALRAAPGSEFARALEAEAALWVNRPAETIERSRPRGDETRLWYGIYVPGRRWNAQMQLGQYEAALADLRAAEAPFRRFFANDAEAQVSDLKLLEAYTEGAREPARVLAIVRGIPRPDALRRFYHGEAAARLGRFWRDAGRRALADSLFALAVADAHEIASRPGASRIDSTFLGWTLYRAGRWAEARSVHERLAASRPTPRVLETGTDPRGRGGPPEAILGAIAAHLGDTAAARRADAWLASLDPRWRLGMATFWRARIAATLGERERAVQLLGQAFAEGIPHPMGWWSWGSPEDVDFEPLRGMPAYDALVRPRGDGG
ncbi:MAG: serine/threonine-protein kinase [Gemmatimonadales bacterium]|nr:serine/threonine-protein kinase [Gemmatimonadales bacterium]